MDIIDYNTFLNNLFDSVAKVTCDALKHSDDWYNLVIEQNLPSVINLVEETDCGRKLSNLDEHCGKELMKIKHRMQELNNLVEQERRSLKQLEDERQAFKREFEKLTKQKLVLEEKIVTNNYKQKLLQYELQIHGCKVLTSADFEYSSRPKYSGYTFNQSTGVIKAFTLDFTEAEKNTEYLWSLVKEVFSPQLDLIV